MTRPEGMSTKAITYLGHATTLLQVGGLKLFTDPHFGRRAWCARRKQPVPVPPETLPEPDAILISHAHHDHLDLHTYKYFSSHVPVIVPMGLAKLLEKFICNPIIELKEGAPWQNGAVTIRAVRAYHHGGRFSQLRYCESAGYLIETGTERIYFAGDTAYREDLAEIRLRGPIDVALLPIGPVFPRFIMRRRHLDPDKALRLAEELDTACMIPIHWGLFRLGFEGAATPLHWLKGRLADSPIADRVRILQPGEHLVLD